MEKDSVKSVSSILRVLFRVIQGAVIGLGAVLPGISGGTLRCIRYLQANYGAPFSSA